MSVNEFLPGDLVTWAVELNRAKNPLGLVIQTFRNESDDGNDWQSDDGTDWQALVLWNEGNHRLKRLDWHSTWTLVRV